MKPKYAAFSSRPDFFTVPISHWRLEGAGSCVLRDKQLRTAPTARLILYDNLDVASEQDQKSH